MSSGMSGKAHAIMSGRTIAWVAVAALLGAVAFLWLSAYAPDMRQPGGPRATPLARTATGYAGIVQLLDSLDMPTEMLRDPDLLVEADPLVVTLDRPMDKAAFEAMVEARQYKPTLYILPKWIATTVPGSGKRVFRVEPLSTNALKTLLTPIGSFDVRQQANGFGQGQARLTGGGTAPLPARAQWLEGKNLTPLIVDEQGHALAARLTGSPTFILADPDLIANHGLKREDTARLAVDFLSETVGATDRPLRFDLTLHGMANKKRNALKLIFEPPFLAFTLVICLAAALAVWRGIRRFGPVREEERAIPLGKAALIDNAAGLIRRTGRERLLGEPYLALVRDRAGQHLGAPASLSGEALEAWLDALPGDARFAPLAERARAARTAHEIEDAAMALFHWEKDRVRERN